MKLKKLMRFICLGMTAVVLATGFMPIRSEAATKKQKNTDLTYVRLVFDADYYYNRYPDVAKAVGNDSEKLLNHYVTFGMKEARNASLSFNASIYKNNYADLRSAFGSDLFAYCKHYVEYGLSEKRNAMDVLETAEQGEIAETISGREIASYSTQFDASIPRATNVKLAASQINGRVLQPNETFSFLGSITPRTRANGYVVATVFSGGKVSKGIGGGICQVSSTIYAAVLGTECRVDERHPHSLKVTYIPEGMDATVVASSKDLRFTNTYNKPMVLSVTADDEGTLTVKIYLQ